MSLTGKARDDVTDTISELAAEQSQVLELFKKEKERGKGNEERGKQETGLSSREPAGERVPKEPRSRSSQSRRKISPKNPGSVRSSTTDPWVNHTFKVRDSKRDRLTKLSLSRKLAGIEPNKTQELVDIALDYVFNNFDSGIKKEAKA